ncbi:ARM repeat-containing protein [Teratosphaeria nubilosa]|uniref:ARM repeat-containing protein n=1 Tax=Teratosphaeria nubilosa TaxID=161662 RepID=A0A6G1L8W8_9PEZI|nr:ARM repeat-containing protein [Teratosphaeria nubilosa]
MASASQTPEQRELSLVGKVEMRIALTDTDSKLETMLKTYLAPLLLKLASEHVSVRNKVVTVCQHISTRIKPQSIQLPVAALVKQFKEQESPMVRHFDLLYIQQGVDRLPAAEKAELLPLIISGIAKSGNHGSQIFNLLLRLLEFFTLPPRGSKEDMEMRAKFEVSDGDAEFLAKWLGKCILFTPQKAGVQTCPGLTSEEYSFISVQGKEGLWDKATGGLNLLRSKALAARLLSSGIFKDQGRFLPALFASADAATTVSDIGDDMLKRAMPTIDLEDDRLVKQLFGLYFGEAGCPRVKAPLRLKILGLLNKSTRSTSFANNIMRLVNDGIGTQSMDGEDVVMSNGPSSSASAGREATKLRSAIFQYVNFVARYGPQETLHVIASQVIAKLRDYLEHQGWPNVGPSEDLVSRAYCYEVIGLLAKAGPKSVLVEREHASLDLLRWLFDSLAQDSSGNAIVVSIEESLSTLLSALAGLKLEADEQIVLEELLIDQMDQSANLEANKRLRSTRYVAVRFANRCLPYASVKARWIDVLGLGAAKDRAEVREEAERGLSPYWYRMLNGTLGSLEPESVVFPRFTEVMGQFFAGRATNREIEPFAIAKQALRSQSSSYSHMTAFARRILFQEAMQSNGGPANLDSEWERRIDTAAESDETTRGAIKNTMRSLSSSTPLAVQTLLSALFLSLTASETIASDGALTDFLALAPDAAVQSLLPHITDLLPVLQSNKHEKRLTAAHAFGILASHPSANHSAGEVHKLLETSKKWKGAVGAVANQVHGVIVAQGYYYGHRSYRGTLRTGDEQYTLYLEILSKMSTACRDASLLEACFVALGQLAMFDAVTPEQLASLAGMRSTIDKIYAHAKEGNETAILALGQLSMILPEEPDKDHSDLAYIEENLYKLHEIRQAESHFAVGEAFSYLACGWQSSALATKLDIEGPRPSGLQRVTSLTRVTDRILKDSSNTKPALKKAAVMWLLCLIQFCGHRPEIQERLPKFQAAFKRCLGDRDELVQETASRGLGLIYEKGDRSLKDDLVRDLVSSFSSDKQSQLAGNVSADTQLFEPGALPTGDGSVSTYKDIMSLASEVGDSSLVYKFMSMASSNAIWSSRAAFGRFGLSSVLSDSSVDGYLANNPKLYPKLYRYRFDPNSGVQRSMNDIWNALVKDSTATIDKYFDDIMEDLLKSILGKEWRVRQASCAAIADLVQGRQLNKYEQYLERIWTQCFKVLDDIKESVRAAAASLARTLTGVLTRALETDHSSTKNASAMLKHVLPFLLSSSGMESSAQEVQAFSVHTLLEIIKKANGVTLRPFIPELVERLIGSLSSLEPEAVNYLHLNASKYNLTEQKIDDMRLSSIRSSPLMEAIERCIDLLDDGTMTQLMPRLESAMRSAVGLPSKVGSSRVLVSLSTRRLVVFRPHADAVLKIIEKVVLDRNETVSSSYAVASGYVARAATEKQILRLVDFSKKCYFEAEGDREAAMPRRAITSGEIIYAMSKHATDRFNAIAVSILPFVFVAKHDPNDHVKEQFQSAWEEAVGGSRAVILYLQEIIGLAGRYLDSAQWVLKHTSARAVADATTTVASLESTMSEQVIEALWPALEKALGGKTWDGKEVVLDAFVKFVESARSWYSQKPNVAAAIVKIATREAKRQNAQYRQHSIKAIGQVCLARSDIDLSGTILDIVEPLLVSSEDSEPMEVDGEPDFQKSDEVMRTTTANAVEALFASINPAVLEAEKLLQVFSRSLKTVANLAQRQPSRPVWRSTFVPLRELFRRFAQAGKGDLVKQAEVTTNIKVLLFGPDPGTEALRLLRADAIVELVRVCAEMKRTMQAEILALQQSEASTAVRDRLGGWSNAV